MIFVSNNNYKLKELRSVLNDYKINSLNDVGIVLEKDEKSYVLEELAYKKVEVVYELTKEEVIADAMMLSIHKVNNWPGIISEILLGEDATAEQRNSHILKKIEMLKDRSATLSYYLIYYNGVETIKCEYKLEGKISYTKRGYYSYGYDDIFELEDGRVLSNLELEERIKVSPRGICMSDLEKELIKVKSKKK